jgi:hypothetical protein
MTQYPTHNVRGTGWIAGQVAAHEHAHGVVLLDAYPFGPELPSNIQSTVDVAAAPITCGLSATINPGLT